MPVYDVCMFSGTHLTNTRLQYPPAWPRAISCSSHHMVVIERGGCRLRVHRWQDGVEVAALILQQLGLGEGERIAGVGVSDDQLLHVWVYDSEKIITFSLNY